MSAPPAATSAADRLSRLLALVPWLLAHPGVPLEAAAKQFDITPDTLVADLELLFVCGTPGHAPDDLIEADWEDGVVHLSNADAIARPLRLGLDEALALVAGLRTLLDVPGVADRDVLTSALAKLSAAAGDAAAAASALRVDLSHSGADADLLAEVLASARTALADRTRLHLRYLVPSRDETTERDVDPMRVLAAGGHWYLEGWCHLAGGVRLFRLDRVLSAQLTGEDGTPPPEAVARDVDDGLFTPSPDDHLVTLALAPGALWLLDHVPVASSSETGDGGATVRLRTADDAWLRRLLLSLGGHAQLLDPPALAAEVAEVAAQALAAYDEAPPPAR